ncbi:MAG: hypothetical protein CM15mP120_18910 [Pseudomonadota bacterium]|nr:MAG: hypothetical protein CM15mP120_18910 [Pseudomonadota bacterium]
MFIKLRVFASAFVCALILNPAWAEEDSSTKRIEDVWFAVIESNPQYQTHRFPLRL